MDTIEISHATKIARKRTILSDVSMTLNRGGIYGFFGINGSGKSMLFKSIAGLVHLSSGSITVFGDEIGKDVSFPPSLGIVLNASMWDEYTGYENLQLLASVKRIAHHDDICLALKRVGLDPTDKRTYRHYSLGMKQRLEIAQAIMERPELLILDEPSNALDSHGLDQLCTIIQEEHQRGATILIAAHNTPELTSLCDRRFEMYEGVAREQ